MATAAGNIDLILVTETKIDSTFSESHFFLMGIRYRTDMTVAVTVVVLSFIHEWH